MSKLGSIITSAQPVATVLAHQRVCVCVGACVCVWVLQREETHLSPAGGVVRCHKLTVLVQKLVALCTPVLLDSLGCLRDETAHSSVLALQWDSAWPTLN
jgi:hypothetical protein